MARRKKKRQCATDGCDKVATLHPVCYSCRQKGCLHTSIHYDSNHSTICSDCGVCLKEGTRKRISFEGKKAIWQKIPLLTSTTNQQENT